jgi:hypothetical protein
VHGFKTQIEEWDQDTWKLGSCQMGFVSGRHCRGVCTDLDQMKGRGAGDQGTIQRIATRGNYIRGQGLDIPELHARNFVRHFVDSLSKTSLASL